MSELDSLEVELLMIANVIRPVDSTVPRVRQVGALAEVLVSSDPVRFAQLSDALGIATRSLLAEVDRGELVIGRDGRTVAVPSSAARGRLERELLA